MSATTARGITYPTVGDVLTPLANRFATLATTTDTAINTATAPVAGYKGTDATRTGLGAGTIPVLAEGLEWYSTDTNRRWFYDGGAWVSNELGDYAIFPTSVANGTQQGDGSVTFSAVSSVSLNGVFSTRFRSYIVKWSIDARSAAAVEAVRLRVGGSDATGANYGWKRAILVGGTISNSASITDTWWSSSSGSGYAQSDKIMRLERPATAIATRMLLLAGYETDGTSIDNTLAYAGYHTVATAYDGISLHATSGTITGSISVHGVV